VDEWLLIYGTWLPEEIDVEIARLRALALNPFNAQTEGTRSYARSTTDIKIQLAAATQVKRDRGYQGPRHGRADFSEVQP
jgi:hypothetical protein